MNHIFVGGGLNMREVPINCHPGPPNTFKYHHTNAVHWKHDDEPWNSTRVFELTGKNWRTIRPPWFWKSPTNKLLKLVGVLERLVMHIYWEFHHPNCLIFFRVVKPTNQITINYGVSKIFLYKPTPGRAPLSRHTLFRNRPRKGTCRNHQVTKLDIHDLEWFGICPEL